MSKVRLNHYTKLKYYTKLNHYTKKENLLAEKKNEKIHIFEFFFKIIYI